MNKLKTSNNLSATHKKSRETASSAVSLLGWMLLGVWLVITPLVNAADLGPGFSACEGAGCPANYLSSGQLCGGGIVGEDEAFSVFVNGNFTVLDGNLSIGPRGPAEAEGVVAVSGDFSMQKGITSTDNQGYNIGVAGAGSCVTAPNDGTHIYVGGTSSTPNGPPSGAGVSIVGELGITGDAELGDTPTSANYRFCASGCDELPLNTTIPSFATVMSDKAAEATAISQCIDTFNPATDTTDDVYSGTIGPNIGGDRTLSCDAAQQTGPGGQCGPGIYIFEDTGASTFDAGFISNINLNAFPSDGSATIIINSSASGTVSMRKQAIDPPGGLTGAFHATHARVVLWNYPNASQVNIGRNVQVDGSILVANGNATFAGSGHNGRFIINGDLTHDGFGSEFHNFDFIGEVPDACGTAPAGSITIVKDAVADNAQDFSFTATGTTPTAFDLDDDADGTLSNTQVFSSLADGSYTFTEAATAGWDLTNISCVGNTASTITVGATGAFDPGDTAVTVAMSGSEDITCTFVNTEQVVAGPTGSIAVNKTVSGAPAAAPWIFQVSSDNCTIPSGVSTTASTAGGGSGVATFTGLPVMSGGASCLYDITELGQNGYSIDLTTTALSSLLGLTVTDGGTTAVAITNEVVPMCVASSDDLGGNVFRDFNSNGAKDGIEPAQSGIVVNAYDNNNTLVASTVVQPDGSYNFDDIFAANTHIRLEFVNLPDHLTDSVAGANSGTTTQFHAGGTCAADLGVLDRCEYCDANPLALSPTYQAGDQTTSNTGLLTRAFDLSGSSDSAANLTQIGSTWGVGWHRETQTVYAGAILKRHAGFGAGGIDAIYAVNYDPATPGSGSLTSTIELTSLGVNVGADPRVTALPSNPATPSHDPEVFEFIAKRGIGDVDVVEDTLYGINMNSAAPSLFLLNVADPTNVSLISNVPIPDPGCADGEYQPWGIGVFNKEIYVGTVCTGETSQNEGDLRAYIQKFDGGTGFTTIFDFDLGYDRGCVISTPTYCSNAEWTAWTDTFQNNPPTRPSSGVGRPGNEPDGVYYPQAILADIEFEADGSMILGFIDRWGHQVGDRQYSTDTSSTTVYRPHGAGDIRRVCFIDGAYELESKTSTSCPSPVGTASAANADDSTETGALAGDAGDFYEDDFQINSTVYHGETKLGGLVNLRSSGELLASTFDPVSSTFSFGWQKHSNSTGLESGILQFLQPSGGGGFGKAAGVGDVELLCMPAPIEIGNRVWKDDDKNGVQDPCEDPISGVEVELFEWNDDGDGIYQAGEIGAAVTESGTPVSAVTNGSGEYYFGSRSGDASLGFVGPSGLDPNTKYVVAISTTQTALSATPQISPITAAVAAGADGESNTGASTATNATHDSDGLAGIESNRVIAPLMTGTAGQNDHTFDFGFFGFTSLGSTVWQDLDADGIQDTLEPSVVGATVTLLNAGGTPYDSDPNTPGVQALTDITDGDGQYNFNDLPAGDYRVQVDLSSVAGGANLLPSPVQVADPDAPGLGQDNNTDSNIDVAFDPIPADQIHISGVITLTVGGEPTGEVDSIGTPGADQPNQGLTAADDPDNAGNMTVDMGFIRPVSLGSTLWQDTNVDGRQSGGEPPIVGATVTLLNADGTTFDSNPFVAGVQPLTDTTDGQGQYNFNDLPPGDYRVQANLATASNPNALRLAPTPIQVADPDAAGPGQDNNTDSNIDAPFDPNPADQIHTSGVVTLTVGGEPTGEFDPIGAGGADQPNQGLAAADDPDSSGNMTVDMGFFEPVSLGSTAWFDSDADGTQDSAEPPIVGATVTLLNANGTVFDSDPVTAGVQALTDVTDGDGQYNFNGLPAGDYRVQVDLNTVTSHTGGGLEVTPVQVADPDAAGPGQDNNTDSNVDTAAPGHNPAGNIYQSGVITLSIGGEPTGEVDPIGAGGADQPNQTAAQPDANGNMTVDFGFLAPVSLGSTIWNDTDADGTQDAAEPAIVGATVTLLNAAGAVFDSNPSVPGVQALTDTTDADGQYNFDGLTPGDYRVQVDLSTVTGGGDYIVSPVQVADPDAAGPGQDNNTDSNVDIAFDVNPNDLIHTSGVITLSPGTEPTGETDPIGAGGADQPNQGLTATDDPDNAGNMTVDMGFIRPVSLGSTVWLDSDEDGVQDAAEPGIVGATVTLLNADGTVFDSNPNVAGVQALTDTTDADGQYNFNDIPEGDYRVQVNLATATNTNAASFIPSPAQVADPDAAGPGQDNNTDSNIDEPFDPNTTDQIHTSGVISLSVGGEPTGETDPIGAGGPDQPNQALSAANQPDANGNMTVDFGFIEPVSIGSSVWFDSDLDGVQDAAEPAIVGVTVTLLNADGTVYDSDPVAAGVQALTDVTDGDGQYNFNDLPEGDYRVQVDLNTATSHTGGGLDPTPTQVIDPDAAGPGQDNNTDSNVDNTAPGHNPAGNIYQSGVVTLSVGGEPAAETDPIGAGGADQPNQTVAQPDTSGNMTIDFGFIAPVSLGSTLWEDTDADGTQDAAEPAIVGATVTLLNTDGTVYDSDPNVAGVQALTDVTDGDGQYNFDNLAPGDYRVQVDLSTVTGGDSYIPSPVQVADPDAAGPGQDNNTDSNIDTAFDTNTNDLIHTSGVVTLTVGGEPTGETDPIGAGGADQPNQGLTATDDPDNAGNMTVDMGFIKPVSLGSTVWLDSDENGVQDAAEPPIVGATITLLNGDGTVFDNDPNTAGIQALTDGTDADGQYNFNDIPAGDYRVQVNLATATNPNVASFVPSPAQVADPDAAGPGQDNNTDSNIDEPFDPNPADQIHTSGVITLTFGGEPSGEVDPIGVGGADQPNQALTAANQPDNAGNMTVDFGFIEPVSIGSTVWIDSDSDGIQDAGEPAIVGVTVTLLNADGTVYDSDPVTAGTQALADVTDADGQYNFNDLPDGDYRVQIDLTTATSHTGGALDPTPTQVADPDAAGPGQDNNTDSNVDTAAPGHNPAGNIYQSGVVSLSAGGEPITETDPIGAGGADQPNQTAAQPDANGNMTVDFGFIAPVSLGSTVWEDLNGNGTQDTAEPPVVGAAVTLLNADGTVYDSDPNVAGVQALTDVTDGDGQYNFNGLPPGDYRVQVDLGTVASGGDLVPSPIQVAEPDAVAPNLDDNTDSNIDTAFDTNTTDQIHTSGVVTLTVGGELAGETDPIGAGGPDQPNQGLTAENQPDSSGNMTVDMGFVRPVSLGSTVWLDANTNGTQDDNEPSIAGATVTLLTDAGVPVAGVAPVVTDDTGQYLFDGIVPGTYRVQVDLSTIPGGGTLIPSPVQVPDAEVASNADSNVDLAADPNPADQVYVSGDVILTAGDEPAGETDPIDGIDNNGPVPDQPNPASGTPDNSGNMTVDMGFYAPVSIGSFVWEDSNGDGLQDTTEPPIAGVQVTLLVETTPGVFVPAVDVNAAPVVSATTGPDGLYQFTNLPVGNYKVQMQLPLNTNLFPSPVQTIVADDNASDSNIVGETGVGTGVFESPVYALTSGGAPNEAGDTNRGDNQDGAPAGAADLSGDMTIDFGFVPTAAIGNYVWLDLDMDGVQDANEDGIAGVEVTLTPPAGVDAGAGPGNPVTVTTGPNGEYLFPNLPPVVDANPSVGYVVTVNPATLPPGLVQSYDEGATGVIGPLDNSSNPIQLDPNEEHLTADFGYAPPIGSLGDTIWIDADDDGIQDPGEPGIPGVVVSVTPPPDVDLGAGPGNPITTTTDENGKYLVIGLPLDETYIVDVDISTLPAGYVSSSSGLGDPDVRDGNSTAADNQTTVVLTTENPVNLDADFGYLPPADQNNSVGDTIWIDADSDGQGPAGTPGGGDTAEQVVPGVTVSLIDNATGDVIATTITDENGKYLFNGVPDGEYTVRVTDQNNVLAGLDPTFDNDGLATPNESVVDLDSGSTSATPVEDLDQDFGYVDSSTSTGSGTIGDTIFFDENNSGTPDNGEGLEGVTVQLFGPGPDGDITTADDNVLLATDTTDENGNYLFTGLDVSDTGANPGTDYQVIVDTATLPNGGDGWSNTVDPDTPGTGDSVSITTLTAATPIDLDQDFGYLGEDGNSLSGTVWPDTNGDGTQVEPGAFSGVTIEVRDEDGNVIRKVRTDADGNYSVGNLPDGRYVVVVTDEDNVLAGFEHTDSPNGASDTSDATSKDDTGYVVDLDSAGTNPNPVSDNTGDFGYEPVVTNPISLGSFTTTIGDDGTVTFNWATQTEVANIGFNVYAQVDGAWEVLNDTMIESQGDAVSIQSYTFSAVSDATVFALSDVDLTGKETLHGPFALGQVYGVISDRQAIDWQAEKAEREAKKAKREALRQEQQRKRSLKRKAKRAKAVSIAPSSNPAVATTAVIAPSLVIASEAWQSSTTEPNMFKHLLTQSAALLVSALIPTAHAAGAEELINLKTTEGGIHEVSVQALADFGVDIVGDSASDLALMNRGALVPIQVTGPDPLTPDSTIRFIASQVDTLYTDTNVYTLSLAPGAASQTGTRMAQDPRSIGRGAAATSYIRTAKFAPQVKYSFTSPNPQDAFYAKRVTAIGKASSERMVVALEDVAPKGNTGRAQAKLTMEVWGGANQPGPELDHSLRVSFNGAEVARKRFDGLVAEQVEAVLEDVREGSNTVELSLPLDTGYGFDVMNLNTVEVSYPSKFMAKNNRLDFTSTYKKFNVLGFTPAALPGGKADLVVMREDPSGTYALGDKGKKASCTTSRCLVQFAGKGKAGHYYVSSRADLHKPTLSALPMADDITSGNVNYLIISHPDFIGSAGNFHLETLKTELESEMGSVDIVDVESIYAQFGYHLFDPTAIKDYIKYAQDNRGTNYVLLVGGDVYDYRKFENEDAESFIPSLYAATGNNITYAPVDAKYVDTDDDNVPDMAIGRLPVRTVSQLGILINKRTDYLNRDYTGKALLVADDYDEVQQYDFGNDANEIEQTYLQNFEIEKAYVDDLGTSAARAKVKQAIEAGTTLTAFFGHSSTNQWSFNGLFTGPDAANLNNQGKPTIVTQWGCWNAYYVSPNEDSMGHRFMMEGDRGAVAVMGASTLTDANNERNLARLVFERLANGERLGDAVTNAKQEYAIEHPNDLDVLLGWTVLGMPELFIN